MNDKGSAIEPVPFKIGEWSIDPARRSVSRGDKIIRLRPRSADVLLHLADRAGQVVTREELLEKFWNGTRVAKRRAQGDR